MDAKQIEKITGKRIKKCTTATGSKDSVTKTRFAKNSVEKHKHRMGRALSNKLNATSNLSPKVAPSAGHKESCELRGLVSRLAFHEVGGSHDAIQNNLRM